MHRLALIGAIAALAVPATQAAGESTPVNARAMRDYARYGLHCSKRDANGRWHLT
jgi:hypothetical protein